MSKKTKVTKPNTGQTDRISNSRPPKKQKTEVDINNKSLSIYEDNKIKEKVPLNNKQISEILFGNKIHIKCKNEKQKKFLRLIEDNQITIASGPAGVGKSYLTIVKALKLLASPDNNYQNIIIIKPVVEAEEQLGFLKGSLEDKLDPYLFSIYYIMDKIIGIDARKNLVETGIIKPMALAYLRGVNIDSSILIFEEAQNSTPGQMKTLLTRIGFNTKFVIIGDLEQSDRYDDFKKSGLFKAMNSLQNMNDVGVFEWKVESDDEIVRNPLIKKILDNYSEE
jgi:phosphate starvation-inducible PhoH-like protein